MEEHYKVTLRPQTVNSDYFPSVVTPHKQKVVEKTDQRFYVDGVTKRSHNLILHGGYMYSVSVRSKQ